MKKIYRPILLICMILALTACTGMPVPTATAPANKEEAPASLASAEPAENEESGLSD